MVTPSVGLSVVGIWNRAEGGAADKEKETTLRLQRVFSRGVKREFESEAALDYIFVEISAILKTSGK